MNLTKKGKLTALITTAVVCLAIIITASVIFAPNFYKDSDTAVTNTDISPYGTYDESTGFGMTKDITFNSSNMALALAKYNDDDRLWIYFPSNIYMDVTENLQSLKYGYQFYAHYGTIANTDYYHTIFHSSMGYYLNGSGEQNTKYNTAWSSDANLAKFFSGYTFIGAANASIGLEYESPDIFNGVKGSTKEPKGNWTWSQDGGDGVSYTATSYNGGNTYNSSENYYTLTNCRMFGTPVAAGAYTYNRLSGTPLFLARKWKNAFVGAEYKFVLTTTESASSASGVGRPAGVDASIPILDDVKININIYDKTPLYNAMKTLENKYNALNTASLLLSGETKRFEALKLKVKNMLSTREVTQKQVETLTTEVTGYIFNVCMTEPNLGSEGDPLTVNYTGGTYGYNNFWNGYKNNVPNTSVRVDTCFPSGTMYYSTTGFGVDAATIADGNKDKITEAGYYTLTFTPKRDPWEITVGGYNIKVKFSWSTGNSDELDTDQKTAYLYIVPATMTLSNMKSAVEMDYKGDTPNTITGLPSGASINLVGTGNTSTVQLCFTDPEHTAGVWNALGAASLDFNDINDAPRSVYYRISATNHFDRYGSFTVKINPADISIKLKSFEQLFNSALLTSDGIFDEMLDESTPNILDSTSFEKNKEYLKKILTFAVSKNGEDGYFDSTVDHPDAGYYTVDAIKTTDAVWARRIDDITFVSDSNGDAYHIKPRPIQVNWIDSLNKWYDRQGGHRPTATIVDGQETFGQTVTLSSVSVVGDQGTALGGTAGQSASSAIRAGSYTARVSSRNSNFTISNGSYVFTILPRKISIEIQPLTIRYAQFKGIEAAKDQYFNSILANNNNNEGYIATLDEEIANSEYATVKDPILHDNYKDVFTVNINAGTTPDGKYYVVGTHELELVPGNANYQITATNGTLKVNPATLKVDDPQVDPKVYNGEAQEIVLPISVDDEATGESGTLTVYGYEYEHFEDEVTVEYSSVGLNGPWSTDPLTITNVIQSGMTVYCRVSANNHTEHKFSFTQEMSAVNITITMIGQTNPVYYGDEIPDSDKIWDDFGFDSYFNETTAQEGESVAVVYSKINPKAIFEFYLNDPSTGQAIVNRNIGAGQYTIRARIKTGTSYDIRNYNLEFEDNKNVNAYTISKKLLYIDWAQSGNRWTGEGKDRYIFSNSIPTVYPTAPAEYDGKENVVAGDSINFAGIGLGSARVNEAGYEVRTRLISEANRRNYTFGNPLDEDGYEYAYHTFYIIPLEVKIVIDDQTAEYGSAQNVTLGELSHPSSVGAIWDYHQDSFGTFYSDHFSYWKFISGAQPSSGFADVKNYSISLLPHTKEGVDADAVRNNYDVKIVDKDGKTEEEGGIMPKFSITPAKIQYTGRVFNFSIDAEDYEDNVITKQMLIERIVTGVDGIEAGDEDEFDVKMSDKYRKNATRAGWVDATTRVSAGDEDNGGEYYIYFQVTHKKGNFEEFTETIELNLYSKWVSITISGGVTTAEYGNPVHSSAKLFEDIEISSITGFIDEDGDQLWNSDPDAAKEKLKEYIELYVIRDRLDSRIAYNEKVGDYSIYFEKIKEDENHANFRFRPRKDENGKYERDASNINAYHVQPRTVDIDWIDMDEDYGDHGKSHTGYLITNAYVDEKGKTDVVRLVLEYAVDKQVERNTAKMVDGHACFAGTYIAEAIGVSNPNYRLKANESDPNPSTRFVIRQKVVDVNLGNQSFDYGTTDAHKNNINGALNVYSPNSPNYTASVGGVEVSFEEAFKGDNRTDIFEIYYEGTVADNLKYLPVDTYVINGAQVQKPASVNYKINFEVGELTINPAKIGLSNMQLNTLNFDATFQTVKIDRSWISLAGDVDPTSVDEVSIGYKFISFETEEDFSISVDPNYTVEGEYKVKDAGRYVLGIEIVADNHSTYENTVSLNVTPATVIINMTQTTKTYGDTIDDLNKETEENTDTLSKWIKLKCGISITRYVELGGGKRTEKDITENAIDDFIFYVADDNNTQLNIEGFFQLPVGEYRVYHYMNDDREYEDGSVGALASNYVVEYYQEPGARDNCNADAYKITPRGVDVTWEINSDNWDPDPEVNNYYYTGRNPNIVARFYALPDADGNVSSETLQFIDTRNPNVGEYTLQVTRSEWNNKVSDNYTINAGSDKFTYNIVKRPITVTIADQSAGTYGKDVLGNYEITQEEYTVYDEFAKKPISSLEDSPIQLVLENNGIAANKFLPAGSYTISGICLNDNYEVEWVNGTLTVDEASLNLRASYTYNEVTYLGKDITLDFKNILPVRNTTFVEDDDWADAWANAEITYADYAGNPVFTGAGAVNVRYSVKVANYIEFTGTVVVDIQVATVNVSIGEVFSIYGDSLLKSKEIFANAEITLAEGSDPIEISIDKIIELYVDNSAVNAGKYNVEFNYVEGQGNNFDVNLVDNGDKYVIKPRPVKLVWGMDEEDSALDSDGKYVFNGNPHKIIFGIDEECFAEWDNSDVIAPRFEETSQKDQAGTYYARLISIGTNGNYTLPEKCDYEWTIKPRPVTVTWTVEEYIYDGTPKAPVAQLNADEILLGTSCGVTVTDGEINAGDYVAVATATSTNYVIVGAEQPFTIKPREIKVVWNNDSFVYDGSAHAPTASVMDGELLEGDTVSEITVSGAQTNAGTYTATVAGLDNSNYVVVGATKTFTIEKKQVTIHWTDTQFDYTGAEIKPNAKLEGVLNGDSVDIEISGGKTDVGTYTATATGVNNGNYVLAPNTVKEMEFTIDKVNNEFDGLYGKGDLKGEIVGIPWLGENTPTNKFGGEVVIKYYEDEACTKEIDVNKIKDGTYWAVAYVEGTDNYNELVSSPLEFTIDNGMNIALAVSGIVISVVLLGAVLTIILVINKKKKGGRA